MASAKLKVSGGKGKNNKILSLGEIYSSMWRLGHRRLQTQLVEESSQGRAKEDKDRGQGMSLTTAKKATIQNHPGSFLLLKSP